MMKEHDLSAASKAAKNGGHNPSNNMISHILSNVKLNLLRTALTGDPSSVCLVMNSIMSKNNKTKGDQ